MPTLDIYIETGFGDIEEESDGSVSRSGASLDMNREYVALRFEEVNIPPGSSIDVAYVEFVAYSSVGGSATLTARCELDADPADFSTGVDHDITGRDLTDAFDTESSIPSWTGGETYQLFDLTGPIAEVIALPGWAQGNPLHVIISPAGGSDRRRAKSYEESSTEAPLLHVEFTDAVAVSLSALSLTATVQTIAPDTTGVADMNPATLTATAETLTVTPGEVQIALAALSLTAAPQALGIDAQVTVALSLLTVTSAALDTTAQVLATIPTQNAVWGGAAPTDVVIQNPPLGGGAIIG